MDANTIICFALVSLALAAGGLGKTPRPLLQAALGALVLVLSAAVFSQYVTGANLGLDWGGTQEITLENPIPGRMPALTAFAFMLCGGVLLGMHRVASLVDGIVIQAMTAAIVVVGLLGAMGRFVPLPLLYSDYQLGQMCLPGAFGLIGAGTGLWLDWSKAPWYFRRRLISRHEQRIILGGGLALTLAVCGTVLAAFLILLHQAQVQAETGQLEALASQIAQLRINLSSQMQRNLLITDRPALLADLDLLSFDPGDAEVKARLRANVEGLLKLGYSGIEFDDPRGRTIAAAGRFVEEGAFALDLHTAGGSVLLWQDGLMLRTETVLRLGTRTVALLKAEQALPVLTQLLATAPMAGQSSEIELCGRDGAQLLCFPQRFLDEVHRLPWNAQRPMARALLGDTGVVTTQDGRGQNVLAAFGPVGQFGLGLVVKTDTADVYQPLRRSMYLMLAIMAGVLALGGWVLYRGVGPLVNRLEASEQRLRQALELAGIALWEWNIGSDSVYLSPRWGELVGEPARPVTLPMSELQALTHAEDLPALREQLQMVRTGRQSACDLEYRVRMHNGRYRWIRTRAKAVDCDEEGRVLRVVGTKVDVGWRKEAEAQLAHQASHDPLTELSNRLVFPDRLAQAMARARRQKSLMALMYLDIDDFKSINDRLGHQAGDVLLKEFATRVMAAIRTTDTAVRLGGDEFVVILEGLISREDGERVAQKLLESMRRPFRVNSMSLRITTSVGLAFYDGADAVHDGPEAMDGEALQRQADEALYKAKAAGRNNVRIAA